MLHGIDLPISKSPMLSWKAYGYIVQAVVSSIERWFNCWSSEWIRSRHSNYPKIIAEEVETQDNDLSL